MCFPEAWARRKLSARLRPASVITTAELAILISDVPFPFRSMMAGYILREHQRASI